MYYLHDLIDLPSFIGFFRATFCIYLYFSCIKHSEGCKPPFTLLRIFCSAVVRRDDTGSSAADFGRQRGRRQLGRTGQFDGMPQTMSDALQAMHAQQGGGTQA